MVCEDRRGPRTSYAPLPKFIDSHVKENPCTATGKSAERRFEGLNKGEVHGVQNMLAFFVAGT